MRMSKPEGDRPRASGNSHVEDIVMSPTDLKSLGRKRAETIVRGGLDPDFYRARYLGPKAAGVDPVRHYLKTGWRLGFDPSPEFSTVYYLVTNPDVAWTGRNPFEHWLAFGRREGRAARPTIAFEAWAGDPTAEGGIAAYRADFDADHYLAANPEVAESGLDPFLHYMALGWIEGRSPSPRFSARAHIAAHPEVDEQRLHPFVHWVDSGRPDQSKDAQIAAEQSGPIRPRPRPRPQPPRGRSVLLRMADWGRRKARNLRLRFAGAGFSKPSAELRDAFDADYYQQRYPDVRRSKIDPLLHYLGVGWKQGRDPSAEFSTVHYAATYPDVRRSGLHPFEHWVRIGRAEGRSGRRPGQTLDSLQLRAPIPKRDLRLLRARFDEAYYLATNDDVRIAGVLPFEHYVFQGWYEGRDPSADFSTSYYLGAATDLIDAGVHPFWHYLRHGEREKRSAIAYHHRLRESYRPTVTVVVPNYQHARFLPQRLQSIFDQTYRNIELVLLDDCSADDSRAVLTELAARSPFPVRTIFNEVNSGNVFAQWAKGFSLAQGELIWICESDDYCEPDFLEHLVPTFADRSVMIAFGRIEFCNEDGRPFPGMDGFRESAEPGIWRIPLVRPAQAWFHDAFGVRNIIANVGGCVIRNQPVRPETWAAARTFRIAGDWFLYGRFANGGKIAYDPRAVAYFRQHGKNTSASNFRQVYFFEEYYKIFTNNAETFGLPEATAAKFVRQVAAEWKHHGMEAEHGDFAARFPGYASPPARRTRHVVMATLGFVPGGGEMFPIRLGNAMVEAGETVSLVAYDMSEINEDMMRLVDPRIAVYDLGSMRLGRPRPFLDSIGASVVHSHMISLDAAFFPVNEPLARFPYVVSMHGSHDTIGTIHEALMFRMLRGVTHWVYTADKNLRILEDLPLDPAAFSKIANAMPPDPRPFPETRAELGIDDDTVVFTLVARGILQKGWRAAITAFTRLRRAHPEAKCRLLLVGSGSRTEELEREYGGRDDITFLGFQSCINGLYRISDCALVPTRFVGESYPLCLIQAMQEGLPIIATDIGEIRNMMTDGEVAAGILLPHERDSETFFVALEAAMETMLDVAVRTNYARASGILAQRFSMEELVRNYAAVYDLAIERADRPKFPHPLISAT